MIVGNVVAVSQTNIKRMLAYSSIAHAGYILMAFVPYGDPKVAADSIASGLFYLVAYALTNFGAWAVVIALETKTGQGLELNDYAGLAKKHPALSAAMAVFMLSLIGFPPTIGMVGKFYLFRAALQGGYTVLALIGVVTSLVSAFYYLRVIVNMYMREGDPTPARDIWLDLTWGLTALATIGISFVPQYLFVLAGTALMR
jgi:NADH-quinone oxidoreductase subunit N